MPFGRVSTGSVRDPVIEPLWIGRRVLAHIAAGEQAQLTDESGEEITEFAALREEIAAANLASTLLVDGYLTASIRDSTGIQAPDVTEGLVSPSQMGRQMIVGGGSSRQEAKRDQAEASLKGRAMPEEEVAGFVAIDLLELDGQSLLDVPLLERKRLLESVLGESAHVRRSPIVRAPPAPWYAQWRAMGFREMAFKAANGRYTPGVVSRDWAIVQIPKR
jgi:ATP-dependent DNA ligase